MDYLEYFGLNQEPFSHAPVSRYYFSSRQHTDALKRLLYVGQTMKGLAILVGDIGHGKTTLARRMLDALPDSEFEAAMLVIVHAGVTANWLLKRIASQLGVQNPADDKLTILSQLYERLVEIHKAGKKAVVLIDEAQMLGTKELMEEFRGMLNLEVPGHKLVSFVFFGLPEIENNLRLDPPLAQRVALRYHLKPLSEDDTAAYVAHRLRLAGSHEELFPRAALAEVHRRTKGVPRMINTLCDNVLLEMFFAKTDQATPELVLQVADNLGFSEDKLPPPVEPPVIVDAPAVPGSPGEDAIVTVTRGAPQPVEDEPTPASVPAPTLVVKPAPVVVAKPAPVVAPPAPESFDVELDPDAIAANVAGDSRDVPLDLGPPPTPIASPTETTVRYDDPLAGLESEDEALAGDADQGLEIDLDDVEDKPLPATSAPPAVVAAPFVPDAIAKPAVAPSVSPVVAPVIAAKPAPAPVAKSAPVAKPAPLTPTPLARITPAKKSFDMSEIDDILADLKKK